MKNRIIFWLSAFVLIISSCKKEDNVSVDMNKYNSDVITPNSVDNWLMMNITNPYNIEVVYRFDRNLADPAKDISPVDLDKVQPIMSAVLDNYLLPYEKIAGKAFIKKLCPKQYVLYGSVAYNSNGSVTLGTADGGRKVTLYGVNGFSLTDVEGENGVRRKLRTIHHEFTHILNQNVIIPPEFTQVTKADYTEEWTNDVNTDVLAMQLGFISRYARSNYGEDFAEMTAHLLVHGQIWFDNYVVSAPASAQRKLRRKEAMVVQYFKDAYGIDFRALQAEIQNVLKTKYGATDPVDLTQTFAAWLVNNKVSTLTFDPAAAHYTTYGRSTTFTTMWNNYVTAVSTQTPATPTNRRYPQTMQLLFTSDTTATVRISYLNNAQTSTLLADYNFSTKIVSATGEVTFIKVLPEGTTTENGNGQNSVLKPFFEQYLLPYFTNRIFIAGWLPAGIAPTSPLYRTFAGFTEKGVAANYFYGPIVLK